MTNQQHQPSPVVPNSSTYPFLTNRFYNYIDGDRAVTFRDVNGSGSGSGSGNGNGGGGGNQYLNMNGNTGNAVYMDYYQGNSNMVNTYGYGNQKDKDKYILFSFSQPNSPNLQKNTTQAHQYTNSMNSSSDNNTPSKERQRQRKNAYNSNSNHERKQIMYSPLQKEQIYDSLHNLGNVNVSDCYVKRSGNSETIRFNESNGHSQANNLSMYSSNNDKVLTSLQYTQNTPGSNPIYQNIDIATSITASNSNPTVPLSQSDQKTPNTSSHTYTYSDMQIYRVEENGDENEEREGKGDGYIRNIPVASSIVQSQGYGNGIGNGNADEEEYLLANFNNFGSVNSTNNYSEGNVRTYISSTISDRPTTILNTHINTLPAVQPVPNTFINTRIQSQNPYHRYNQNNYIGQESQPFDRNFIKAVISRQGSKGKDQIKRERSISREREHILKIALQQNRVNQAKKTKIPTQTPSKLNKTSRQHINFKQIQTRLTQNIRSVSNKKGRQNSQGKSVISALKYSRGSPNSSLGNSFVNFGQSRKRDEDRNGNGETQKKVKVLSQIVQKLKAGNRMRRQQQGTSRLENRDNRYNIPGKSRNEKIDKNLTVNAQSDYQQQNSQAQNKKIQNLLRDVKQYNKNNSKAIYSIKKQIQKSPATEQPDSYQTHQTSPAIKINMQLFKNLTQFQRRDQYYQNVDRKTYTIDNEYTVDKVGRDNNRYINGNVYGGRNDYRSVDDDQEQLYENLCRIERRDMHQHQLSTYYGNYQTTAGSRGRKSAGCTACGCDCKLRTKTGNF